MDIYNSLVYTVKRPIHITLNKCSLIIMGCPFWGDGSRQKGTPGGGVENVF